MLEDKTLGNMTHLGPLLLGLLLLLTTRSILIRLGLLAPLLASSSTCRLLLLPTLPLLLLLLLALKAPVQLPLLLSRLLPHDPPLLRQRLLLAPLLLAALLLSGGDASALLLAGALGSVQLGLFSRLVGFLRLNGGLRAVQKRGAVLETLAGHASLVRSVGVGVVGELLESAIEDARN